MPVAIALIGIILLVAAWQNTLGLLGTTLANDFDSHFMAWLGVVFVLGIAGYASDALKTPSRAFLGLILLAYFISNRGIFAQFQQQLTAQPSPAVGTAQQGPVGPAPIQLQGATGTSPSSASGAGSNGLGGTIGSFFGSFGL